MVDKTVNSGFSPKFREAMIRKLAAPGGPSAGALSEKVGVSQSTLSRWLREAGTVPHVTKKTKTRKQRPSSAITVDAEPPRTPRRPQDWSPEEKMRVLREAEGLKNDELGALLRREGLHETHIQLWRRDALDGLGGRRQRTGEQKRVRELERELRRKEKALAEAAALLVLQKKTRALWGDEGENTP